MSHRNRNRTAADYGALLRAMGAYDLVSAVYYRLEETPTSQGVAAMSWVIGLMRIELARFIDPPART